jgi:hypothetical protein
MLQVLGRSRGRGHTHTHTHTSIGELQNAYTVFVVETEND